MAFVICCRSLGQVGRAATQRGAKAGSPAETQQLPQHPQERADYLCELQLPRHSQPCHSHVCPRRPSLIWCIVCLSGDFETSASLLITVRQPPVKCTIEGTDIKSTLILLFIAMPVPQGERHAYEFRFAKGCRTVWSAAAFACFDVRWGTEAVKTLSA